MLKLVTSICDVIFCLKGEWAYRFHQIPIKFVLVKILVSGNINKHCLKWRTAVTAVRHFKQQSFFMLWFASPFPSCWRNSGIHYFLITGLFESKNFIVFCVYILQSCEFFLWYSWIESLHLRLWSLSFGCSFDIWECNLFISSHQHKSEVSICFDIIIKANEVIIYITRSA